LKSHIRHTEYILLIVIVSLLLIPFIVIGRSFRIALLPDKGENFGCGTCHVNPGGGGVRNSFGRDWEAIAIPRGDKYVPEIANRDSDGDGFTNDEEFEAEKHPGDPQSKPDPPQQPVTPRGKSFVPWGKVKSSGRN
jgi:hypothetical protein